jgi:hypothetical protein
MAAHFSQFMPKDENSLMFMKNEYFRELHNYDKDLVIDNLTNHIRISKYPPSVSELIKKPERESGSSRYVPGVKETLQNVNNLMLNEKAAEKEEADFYKDKIKNILEGAVNNVRKSNFNPFE